MSVTSIPGTNYTIQDNQIQNPDGKAISKDAFINEVQSKGINLNSDALKILGEKFGTDYENKLQNLNKTGVSTTDLNDKVGNNKTGDLMLMIMLLMHETARKQRETSRNLADKTVDLQVNSIEKQADNMKAAAVTRLITGVATAAFQVGMGMAQAKSSLKAGAKMQEAEKMQGLSKEANKMNLSKDVKLYDNAANKASFDAKQIQNTQYATSQYAQAGSGLIGAGGNFIASMFDTAVKEAEKEGVMFGHMTDNAKKLFDEATDLERKVREILGSMAQSEAQAERAIANMG